MLRFGYLGKELNMKKAILCGLLSVMVMGSSGCFLLVAGTVAGVGTAYWLSEKLTQLFDVPYDQVVAATERALLFLKLPILKEEKTAEVTQFKSVYAIEQDVWVDVRRVSDASTKVEVRVGTVSPNKDAAEKILRQIKRSL